MESFLFNGGKLITQVFIVNMGTIPIAANTIANSITNMLNIPGMALSIAATALVGQYMGRGNSSGAEDCLSYLNKVSTVCLVVLALISVPAAGVLSSLYTENSSINTFVC